MGCNGLLPKLERLLDIEEVSMYQEVDMAFIIAKRGRGVPVYDLSDFLNSIKYIPVRLISGYNENGEKEEDSQQTP